MCSVALFGTCVTFVFVLCTGTPAKSSSAQVVVTVTNIKNNAPEFEQELYSLSLAESTPVGTTVLQVNASDADSAVLTYSIVSGNTANAFSLTPISGTGLIIISHEHNSVR